MQNIEKDHVKVQRIEYYEILTIFLSSLKLLELYINLRLMKKIY